MLADAVCATLGPNGRNVVISKDGELNPFSTKDGVTVAKSVKLKDPAQELGVQLIRQAADKTAQDAGDGTTTSTLLAYEMINNGLEISCETSTFKVSTITSIAALVACNESSTLSFFSFISVSVLPPT